MKNMFMKKLVAIMCASVCLAGCFAGCGKNPGTASRSGQSTSYEEEANYTFGDLQEKTSNATYDFGVKLLQNARNANESTLVSPVSVYTALAMVANGADNRTLSQMEAVLGMSVPEMNVYTKEYMELLKKDSDCKVRMANSVWLNDNFDYTFRQDTMNRIKDFYGSETEESAFDEKTLEKMNQWVDNNTDHMISKILDQISPEAVMYLMNALVFDAKWEEQYEESDVFERIFTMEDGTETQKSFMNGTENIYLSDDDTTGFVKYYKGGRFAFVGLLPEVELNLDEYVADLSGEKLQHLLERQQKEEVYVAIPEFEKEYEAELAGVLDTMGMGDAFDASLADFSKFTEEQNHFFVNRVIHKTYICVDPKGTKAAAVTAVEMKDNGISIDEEPRYVILDRPFVYVLWDSELNMPLFLGTMEE